MSIHNSSKCIACGGYHYMDGLPCPMYTITDVPTITFNEYSYNNNNKLIPEDEQDVALLRLMQSNHCKVIDFPDDINSEEDFIKWIKENN